MPLTSPDRSEFRMANFGIQLTALRAAADTGRSPADAHYEHGQS